MCGINAIYLPPLSDVSDMFPGQSILSVFWKTKMVNYWDNLSGTASDFRNSHTQLRSENISPLAARSLAPRSLVSYIKMPESLGQEESPADGSNATLMP